MFQIISKQNNFGKWFFRIIGTLLTILGISSLFSPIQKLADKVPVIRNITSMATGTVSFVLGLSISFIVIAIAWFRFRPMLSIILIVIVVLLIVFLKLQSNGNVKLPKKEETAEK